MKLGILSRGDGWHIQDLLRAARELGHTPISLDFRKLTASQSPPLHDYDGLIIRTMPAGSLEQVVFRMDVLQAYAASGRPILNPPRAVETCVDKYLTNVRLQQAGLPVPRTVVCQTLNDAMLAWESLGGDVVVKPLFGAEGRGMVRVSERELAWRTFHTLEQTQAVLYLQEFLRHPGWDVRAFVLNQRVVGSMRRSNRHDWRTNVAQGGDAERWDLPATLQELALAAATATGAIAAGVDLIQNDNGHWFIIEVNAVPGWKALAPTCGLDIANLLIRTLIDSDD
jgi:ribosomal protein S6--L-glutamate ligase